MIVFIEGHSWISNVIRFFDKGRFTHVGISVNALEIIEAQRFQVVRAVPLGKDEITLIDLHLNEEERIAILQEAKALTGIRYDYMQIFWQLLKKLSRGHIKGINSPKRLICSELISRVLYSAGIVPKDDTLFGLTPNELYDYLLYIEKSRRP